MVSLKGEEKDESETREASTQPDTVRARQCCRCWLGVTLLALLFFFLMIFLSCEAQGFTKNNLVSRSTCIDESDAKPQV